MKNSPQASTPPKLGPRETLSSLPSPFRPSPLHTYARRPTLRIVPIEAQLQNNFLNKTEPYPARQLYTQLPRCNELQSKYTKKEEVYVQFQQIHVTHNTIATWLQIQTRCRKWTKNQPSILHRSGSLQRNDLNDGCAINAVRAACPMCTH